MKKFLARLLLTLGLALSLQACAAATASPTASITPPGGRGTQTPTQAAYPGPATTTSPTTATSPTVGLPTQPPALTPTLSPTASATSGPSPTPTPALLVLAGTPLPLPLAPISAGNAAQASGLTEFLESPVTDLEWTPDGLTLAVARIDGISLYDVQSRTRLRSLYPRGEGVVSIAFSSDGSWLAAGSRPGNELIGSAGNIELWAGPYWRPLGLLYGETRGLAKVAFSPDANVFAAAFADPEIEQDSSVEFWNTTSWEITRTLQTGTALNLAFSPDGKTLASVPDRYAIKIWRMSDARLLTTLHTSFTGAVNSLVFSSDGRLLATGHYDGIIRLWDVASGELRFTMQAEGVIESLAFSPDNSLLASGESYANHFVRLWAAQEGQLLRTLEGHTHAVDNLVFSPSGQILVSSSYDGTVRLWGVRP